MTEQTLADLLAASSPFKTFVTDLLKSENVENKTLGAQRRKVIQQYVTKFFTALLEKLRQLQSPPIVSSSAHSAMDTSNSMGNTTTDSSLHSKIHAVSSMHQSLGNDSNAAAQTMSIEAATPMDMNETTQVNLFSPISTCSSSHNLNDASFNDMNEISMTREEKNEYRSRLFLENSSSDYTFGDHDDSVPHAKPFHMYTKNDLLPVVCASSFLYIVFRDLFSFDVSFFKVKNIYKVHAYAIVI